MIIGVRKAIRLGASFGERRIRVYADSRILELTFAACSIGAQKGTIRKTSSDL